jgi:DNA polymerase III alpha subunit (gram-positive type)
MAMGRLLLISGTIMIGDVVFRDPLDERPIISTEVSLEELKEMYPSKADATYCFIDTETTGFDPLRNQVLTLACYVTDESYNILGEHYGEFRPDGKREIVWSEGAEKVHGVSWQQSQAFKDAKEAGEDLLNFLEAFPSLTFIAHNMPFDRRMLRGTLSRNDQHFRFYKCFPRFMDTIPLVKATGLTSSKSKSLGAICSELCIEHNHHDARSDAKVLIEIHKRCTQALGNEALMTFVGEINE